MIYFLILFICITLDAFIYMMEKGATIRNMDLKFVCKQCFIFASINTCIYLLANRASYLIFSIPALLKFHQRTSLLFLISIGILLLIKTAKRRKFEEKLDLDFNTKTSVKKAFITGIDTLLMGVYASTIPASIYLQSLSAFIIVFGMIYIALKIGYNHGAAYQRVIGYTSAGIYLFMAAIQALIIF